MRAEKLLAMAVLAACAKAPPAPAPTPTAVGLRAIADSVTALAATSGNYCRTADGTQCIPNLFGGVCPDSHPVGSSVPCPTPTPGPSQTPTRTPTAPSAATPTKTPTSVSGWTYAAIGRPPDAHYSQGATGACSGSWTTVEAGDCYLALDWGKFSWPDPDGAGFEEVGIVRYPKGEPTRYERIERGATSTQGKGTHECPYPSLLFDRGRLWVSYARTTYESIGCDDCRIRGSLASWDGRSWSLWEDWLRPLRPEATFRCCDKPAQAVTSAGMSAMSLSATRGHGRTMMPPVPEPLPIGVAAAAVTTVPAWTGNVGWTTALFSLGGGVYLVTYDNSVPGGPWVLYYVESDWSGVVLMTPMQVPSSVVWVDDCGWSPTPQRLVCLATTTYNAWRDQRAVSEIASVDMGRSWQLTGRTFDPPGDLRAFEPGYLRRLEDGGVWEDAVFLTVGTGGHAANAEGDWKTAIMYRPGTSAPVTRFLDTPPGWSR